MPEKCSEHGEKIAVLETRLGGIEGKLDELIVLARSTNGRVRKLELWRAWLTGGVAFTLIVASSTFALLKWVLA